MSHFGGYSPGAEKYGGGPNLLQRIVESLNTARGTGYDTEQSGNVFAENMAFARSLGAAWSSNSRFGHQWDPARMTDFLPRWESILGLSTQAGDTDGARRDRVARPFARFGKQFSLRQITDELTDALGDSFVTIEFTDLAGAIIHWPGDGSDTPANPWYSTVATIRARLTQPVGLNPGDFYGFAGLSTEILDALVPAWANFIWYRADAVTDLIGFYLDSEHNLDNSIFDE